MINCNSTSDNFQILNTKKSNIIKTIDILGRSLDNCIDNKILFNILNNGKVEKKLVVN